MTPVCLADLKTSLLSTVEVFYVTILETDDHLHAYVITYTSNRSIILSTLIHSHIPMHYRRVHSRENEVFTVIVCRDLILLKNVINRYLYSMHNEKH